jgi:hypothetical protein
MLHRRSGGGVPCKSRRIAWPSGRCGAQRRPVEVGGRGREHGRLAGSALGRDSVEVAAAALGGAQKRKSGPASAVLGGEPVEVAAIASYGGAGGRPARWSEDNPWRSRSSPAVEERMARLRTDGHGISPAGRLLQAVRESGGFLREMGSGIGVSASGTLDKS